MLLHLVSSCHVRTSSASAHWLTMEHRTQIERVVWQCYWANITIEHKFVKSVAPVSSKKNKKKMCDVRRNRASIALATTVYHTDYLSQSSENSKFSWRLKSVSPVPMTSKEYSVVFCCCCCCPCFFYSIFTKQHLHKPTVLELHKALR